MKINVYDTRDNGNFPIVAIKPIIKTKTRIFSNAQSARSIGLIAAQIATGIKRKTRM